MKKFIVVYDKTANFTVLENNLVNAGCTILSHLSALHVLTLECADTSFETVPGVLTVEEEHEITITEHWHLRRITCRQLPLKSLYLPKNLGTNVVVYLVDSGIDISHPQFVNANIQNLWSWDENFTDVNGHGTAMASLIVGESLGVVPEAILKNVQIPFGTSITTSVLLTAFLVCVHIPSCTNVGSASLLRPFVKLRVSICVVLCKPLFAITELLY